MRPRAQRYRAIAQRSKLISGLPIPRHGASAGLHSKLADLRAAESLLPQAVSCYRN